MSEAKTKPTDASVEAYIASRAIAGQAADCKALIALLSRLTGEAPRMWGPSIVGFGSYQYTYESGRTGVACLTGFAIRAREIVLYLDLSWPDAPALLSRLGKHKTGKGCLYFKALADLDGAALERLVAGSVAELRRRHGASGT